MGFYQRTQHWLHSMYPMGTVERLPAVSDDGSTRVKGLYVVGDLTGIPLLKFSQDSGTRVVRTICEQEMIEPGAASEGEYDLVILGAGVSGISAALEAKKCGLKYTVLEAAESFSTIVNFPKAKPIYLYPTEMQPEGDLKVTGEVKESLLEELREQVRQQNIEVQTGIKASHVERHGGTMHVVIPGKEPVKAKAVIIAIGRSGNYRKLNVPGEDLNKVYNRLHDPADYAGQKVLVVGGGDSAAEAAVALAQKGAEVTVSYRGKDFNRPKPENVEKLKALASDKAAPGKVRLIHPSVPKEIRDNEVDIIHSETNETETLKNDHVFSLIGREAPLDFFRKSGVPIQGEWRPTRLLGFAAFLFFCVWLYSWKGGGFFYDTFSSRGWFPWNFPDLLRAAGINADNPATLWGTLRISMSSPSFYYTLAYCAAVGIFGIRRVRRRKTPYVKIQTTALFLIQFIPLFLLPEILLPWMGHNSAFDSGFGRQFADALFPLVNYGHGREYWRAVGFILAWPLFLYNVFTDQPMLWWLAIGSIQTFVIIPGIIYFWGKGAYCGWICSCGALAETLGDAHRTKMPHGPFWSKFNMAGQVILWAAFALLLVRIGGWIFPGSWADQTFDLAFGGEHYNAQGELVSNPVNYKWLVDISLAGIVGVGFYFWFSGRVWCRFFCPLAALMHVFTKFSRFRIIPDKKKCISCNVCTSVCHQGIDVMNFANKGIPMEDPECVRCSACVQMCPTGVLQFGQVDKEGRVIKYDSIAASPVLMREEREKAGTE